MRKTLLKRCRDQRKERKIVRRVYSSEVTLSQVVHVLEELEGENANILYAIKSVNNLSTRSEVLQKGIDDVLKDFRKLLDAVYNKIERKKRVN